MLHCAAIFFSGAGFRLFFLFDAQGPPGRGGEKPPAASPPDPSCTATTAPHPPKTAKWCSFQETRLPPAFAHRSPSAPPRRPRGGNFGGLVPSTANTGHPQWASHSQWLATERPCRLRPHGGGRTLSVSSGVLGVAEPACRNRGVSSYGPTPFGELPGLLPSYLIDRGLVALALLQIAVQFSTHVQQI